MKKESLLDFFLDLDGDEAVEYLEKNNIDYKTSKAQLLEYIEQKKGELKIKKGEKLKELFKNAFELIKNDISKHQEAVNEYRIACRQIDSLTEDDKKIIEENIRALQEMEKNKGE